MALIDFLRLNKQTTIESKPTPPVKDELDLFSASRNIEGVLNLRNIDIPKVKENTRDEWVLFGHNNSFPLDLLEYLNNSSIHNAIIESKASLISGNGLLFAPTREESNQYIIDNWKKVPFWGKLDKIFYQVVKDQQIFGYSCFEIIYSMDRTRIVDINWIDASRIAMGKMDENERIKNFYYSKNWENTNRNPPVKIAAFDTNGEEYRQLVFISNDRNNMDYYSLPSYYSALKWVKADMLMAEYNLGAINNGFSPSIVFKFYKKPTPEERRMNSESIKRQHSGPKNAGKAIILYSDGKELSPDIDTLDSTNIDSRLIEVSKQIVQNIITAHRAHPQLLGIQTAGKLGNSNELIQAWEIFDKMVVRPERKLVLDAFKEVLIYNGVSYIDIEELKPIKITEIDENENDTGEEGGID